MPCFWTQIPMTRQDSRLILPPKTQAIAWDVTLGSKNTNLCKSEHSHDSVQYMSVQVT